MARKNLYPPSVTPGIPKLGEKPIGWVETTFGDVLQVVQRRVKMDDDKEYQLVTAKRSRGGIVPRSTLKGRDILTKTQFYIKSDDFLISRRQIIHGACGIVPPALEGAIVSNEYSTLRVKEGLLLEFLRYFCHTKFFQQTCFQASVGVDVEKMIFDLNEWLKYKVYLPPVGEQHKIAEILCTWDQAITLTEQLIAAKQRRKKGLMQQLLTGRRRFGEFEGEEWKKVSLGDFGYCIRGVSYNPDEHLRSFDQDNTIRLLRANNIYQGKINTDEIQYVVSEACKEEQILDVGDIAICMASGSKHVVGKAARFDQKDGFLYTVGAFCSIFRLKNKADSDFVNQLFQSTRYRKGLRILLAGSSINNLKPSDIESVHFVVPSDVREQRKIAAVLQACDQEIELLKQKLDALKRQKKGLMQRLLTGQVRVGEPSPPAPLPGGEGGEGVCSLSLRERVRVRGGMEG